MKVEFKEVERIIKTLPVGYYLTRGALVTLSPDSKATFARIINDEIVISYPMIASGLAPLPKSDDPELVERAVRCLLYHEVSHLFITPANGSSGARYNIFEDERMETLLRKYYLKVNFKWFAKLMNGGSDGGDERPENAERAFWNLVRMRNYRWCPEHEAERLSEVKSIIADFASMGRIAASSVVSKYENRIDRLFWAVRRDLDEDAEKKSDEKSPTESGEGGEGDSSEDKSGESSESKGDESKSGGRSDKSDKGDDEKKGDDAGDKGDDAGDKDDKGDAGDDEGGAGDDRGEDEDDAAGRDEAEGDGEDGKGDGDEEKSGKGKAGAEGDKEGEKSSKDSKSDGGEAGDGETSESGDGSDPAESGEGGDPDDDMDGDDPSCADDPTISKKEVEKLVTKLFDSNSLPAKDLAALDRIFRAAEKKRAANASATNAHSGILDPRQVALRDDYRWWLHHNVTGSHARFAKTHLTLFMDVSGSFSNSSPKLNALVQALLRVKKSNRNFEFDIIAMGDTNRMFDPTKEKRIVCSEGNYFGNDVIPLARKCRRADCENYQLVVFDGDAMSCDGWGTTKRNEFRNENMGAWRVFDDNRTVIVTDECNEGYLNKAGVTKAKRVIVYHDYAEKFIENVIKLLAGVVGR